MLVVYLLATDAAVNSNNNDNTDNLEDDCIQNSNLKTIKKCIVICSSSNHLPLLEMTLTIVLLLHQNMKEIFLLWPL